MSSELDGLLLGASDAPNLANELVEKHNKRALVSTCRRILELLTANNITLEVFAEVASGIGQEQSTPEKLRGIRADRKPKLPVGNTEELVIINEKVEVVDEPTGEEPTKKSAIAGKFNTKGKRNIGVKADGRTDEEVSGEVEETPGEA